MKKWKRNPEAGDIVLWGDGCMYVVVLEWRSSGSLIEDDSPVSLICVGGGHTKEEMWTIISTHTIRDVIRDSKLIGKMPDMTAVLVKRK